jgi:diketogulonate reductase-like aldo/keto reductase
MYFLSYESSPHAHGRLWTIPPAIGFGTYTLYGDGGTHAIVEAIHLGYRLIDSAVNYENEGAVGAAIRRSGLAREELIITSKLPGRHHHFDDALNSVQESVMRMGLENIDLYLIHWPNPIENLYVEAWRGLIEARNRGLVHHIGVSNFLPEHLERLRVETGELPAINQIELHPYFPQTDLVAYHREHGILTEAWSPLGKGSDLLTNPVITTIATEHEVTPAQTVLAWHVNNGAIPIPKSRSVERQRENLDIFNISLTHDNIERIATLARTDGRLENQDPALHQEF